MQSTESTLDISNVFDKLSTIDESCHKAMMGWVKNIPFEPARDVEVLNVRQHPPKKGLSYKEGQARLLHDLANIELQAMELGLRTLIEFPDAPKQFREQLTEITLSEASHLKLCLNGIEQLGFKWGDWPVHIALWKATHEEDSIIDRILIVHRYLEGSGLDAGESIMRKLAQSDAPLVTPVMKRIFEDEVGHVLFGSYWYKEICKKLEIDPEYDFPTRLQAIAHKIPNRLEKINPDLRKKAGFDDFEVKALIDFQIQQKAYLNKR
jgi:uncharacterized ferritin-like protein (DUF455 family)